MDHQRASCDHFHCPSAYRPVFGKGICFVLANVRRFSFTQGWRPPPVGWRDGFLTVCWDKLNEWLQLRKSARRRLGRFFCSSRSIAWFRGNYCRTPAVSAGMVANASMSWFQTSGRHCRWHSSRPSTIYADGKERMQPSSKRTVNRQISWIRFQHSDANCPVG